MKIIINTSGKYEAISLDNFIKDYGLTPKCTGDEFYTIHQEGRDWFINSFPNPACIFSEGQFLYIVLLLRNLSNIYASLVINESPMISFLNLISFKIF